MIHPRKEVQVIARGVPLRGYLEIPERAPGLVIFAHGSGSGRHSPRNQFVATVLQEAGLGTLLLDLLTEEEGALDAHTAHLRFDIDLLAERLGGATEWVWSWPDTASLLVGYFGASTGAAAALQAAAQLGTSIAAVVSRGGRPDLAERFLPLVRSPTLLIVGELDVEVLKLNRRAYKRIEAERALEIVPGASHLFEEPGTLEAAARLATAWFARHLHSRIAKAPAAASGTGG